MLVEIRRYTIEPGRRDEFVAWFEREVMPAMEAEGMRILGMFVGVEDPDSFFYLRGFTSEEERARQIEAFYDSAEWDHTLRPRAMEMEESFHVELVRSTEHSPI
ncbi:MAG TPA: NIPSNAP family protein [Acidimicrobiia bacterium]|jgi:heme-degrading monooxygenase HmoA